MAHFSQELLYPFGMGMPGRKFEPANGYRYGFNGKEKDKDMAADDYDFGARIYDGRIGRWLSMDPKLRAFESPFIAFSNNPILVIDPDGEDGIVTIKRNPDGRGGTITVKATVHLTGNNAQKHADAANNFIAKNKDKFSRTLVEQLSPHDEQSEAIWQVNIEIVYVVGGKKAEGENDTFIRKIGPDMAPFAETKPTPTGDETFNKENKKSLNGDKRFFASNYTEIGGIEGYAEDNQGNTVLVHEPLHNLGFSERYNPKAVDERSIADPGFFGTNDIMQRAATDDNWSIGNLHFQNLLNFCLKESSRLTSIGKDPNSFILKHMVDRDNSGSKIGQNPNEGKVLKKSNADSLE